MPRQVLSGTTDEQPYQKGAPEKVSATAGTGLQIQPLLGLDNV